MFCKNLWHFTQLQKRYFIVLFLFMLTGCRYESEKASDIDPSRIFKPQNDIKIPSRAGKIVDNCNEDTHYNACIYKKNPVAQKGASLSNNVEDFHQEMVSLQNYAIQITGAFGGYLQNSHYSVTINLKDAQGNTYPKVQLSNGKWTTPYKTDWVPEDEGIDYSVEQVMTYHYLMYQKEWMQQNAGYWFAHNKRIIAVAFEDIEKHPQWLGNAYWSSYENKIVLGADCLSFEVVKGKTVCKGKMGIALSSEITLHEAGHANFTYANRSRLGRGCQTHRNCHNTKQSLCDTSTNINEAPRICCDSAKGCLYAINEGQADFHASIISPEKPQIGEFLNSNPKGLRACLGGPLRDPEANTDKTADELFHSCTGYGRGEIHISGILYNSIWWSIYQHPETLHGDILSLFTQHLPILSYDDTFETAGMHVVNLAKQMFGNAEGSKGLVYAKIIEDEFAKRGLNVQ